MTLQFGAALLVGVAAIVEDVARRRISNWIPCSAFGLGVVVQTLAHGWAGVGSALLGTATGFVVFLIFYLLGGMGGGDVKLMAGFGALLGVRKLLEAALWTAACGGLLAAAVIGFDTARSLWRTYFARDTSVTGNSRVEAIPYAPAIAAGVWLSLVPKA